MNRRTRAGLLGATAGVVVVAMAVVVGALVRDGRSADRSSADDSARPAVVAGEPAQEPAGVTAPVRIEIPRIGVRSRLDRLRLRADGSLEKPPRWQVAGWYAAGPRPGDPGPAVIAGHVDSPSGPAVFARLAELRRGDVVRVRTRAGDTETFRVDRTLSAPKRRFPTAQVYGPAPDSQLRLVTCDGTYDRARDGYQDNLVVFATRATGVTR